MDEACGILSGFLRAVFPDRCPVCGEGQGQAGPCVAHRLPLNRQVNRCPRCAARLAQGIPQGFRCFRCARRSLGLRRVLALGDYHTRASLRDWVLALKHGGRAGLAGPLGLELARLWRDTHPGQAPPLLVPVPLHPLRRLERGYDQALLLAVHAAEEMDATVLRALARSRWTAPQGSGVESRVANVSEAFRLCRAGAKALPGREVWLVDDVLTSGATLGACATVLRRGGARRVAALVVARAGAPQEALECSG